MKKLILMLAILVGMNVQALESPEGYEFVEYTNEKRDDEFLYEEVTLNRFYTYKEINSEYLELGENPDKVHYDPNDYTKRYVCTDKYNIDIEEANFIIDFYKNYVTDTIKILDLNGPKYIDKIEIYQGDRLIKELENKDIKENNIIKLDAPTNTNGLKLYIEYEIRTLLGFTLNFTTLEDGYEINIPLTLHSQASKSTITVEKVREQELEEGVIPKATAREYFCYNEIKYRHFDLLKVYYIDSELEYIQGYTFDKEESYQAYKKYRRIDDSNDNQDENGSNNGDSKDSDDGTDTPGTGSGKDNNDNDDDGADEPGSGDDGDTSGTNPDENKNNDSQDSDNNGENSKDDDTTNEGGENENSSSTLDPDEGTNDPNASDEGSEKDNSDEKDDSKSEESGSYKDGGRVSQKEPQSPPSNDVGSSSSSSNSTSNKQTTSQSSTTTKPSSSNEETSSGDKSDEQENKKELAYTTKDNQSIKKLGVTEASSENETECKNTSIYWIAIGLILICISITLIVIHQINVNYED